MSCVTDKRNPIVSVSLLLGLENVVLRTQLKEPKSVQ